MSTVIKKLFMVLIGCVAGLASWAVIEILLFYGELIGRHVLWNGLAGASIGLFFGFFFGSAEGIMFSDNRRALRGGLTGSFLGLIGGAGVVILAQWLLYAIGNTEFFSSAITDSLVIPISRAIGWGLLGLVIGSLDGLRSGSARRSFIGMAGGFSGGLLGGLLLEFLTRLWSNGLLARGAGLVLMGVGIGLCFTLFEYSRSYGIVRILTGPYRGKEYVLIMKNTRLGSSLRAHIPLGNYSGVVKNHAVFRANRDGVVVEGIQGPLIVNDETVKKQELKYEDVIQIGSAKFLYLPA